MWDRVSFKAVGSELYTGALMALNREWLDYYVFPAGITLTLPERVGRYTYNPPPWKRKY